MSVSVMLVENLTANISFGVEFSVGTDRVGDVYFFFPVSWASAFEEQNMGDKGELLDITSL